MKSRLWMLALSICPLLGGCAIPYFTGGDVSVKAMIADAKTDTSGWFVPPGNEVPKGRVPDRYVIVTFHEGCQDSKPDGVRLLDAYLMRRQGQEVAYPLRFHVSLWGPFSQGRMAWTLDREKWAFIAFAPGCWPAAACEKPIWKREDLEQPTIITKRYGPGAGITESIPYEPANMGDDFYVACPTNARVSFYPRGKTWGDGIFSNLTGAGFLPERTAEFVEVMDNSWDFTDADRLMVFQQTLEIVQRLSVRTGEWENPERYDNAKQLLRKRILELCQKTGSPPPPAPDDDETWLATVKAAVATKGVKEASSEWLGVAIDEGLAKCATYLLARGADPVVQEGLEGHEPLIIAARRGNMQIAKVLLAADARKGKFYEDKSHLHRALEAAGSGGQHEMAEFLLTLGASANQSDQDGYSLTSPLMQAVRHGDCKMAALLLKHGAKVDYAYSTGTALSDACGEFYGMWGRHTQADRMEMVKLLLEHGANVNGEHDSRSPLREAAEAGIEQVVRVLLEHGADVNLRDYEGMTPLKIAIKNHAPWEVIQMLRAHGGKE